MKVQYAHRLPKAFQNVSSVTLAEINEHVEECGRIAKSYANALIQRKDYDDLSWGTRKNALKR